MLKYFQLLAILRRESLKIQLAAYSFALKVLQKNISNLFVEIELAPESYTIELPQQLIAMIKEQYSLDTSESKVNLITTY